MAKAAIFSDMRSEVRRLGDWEGDPNIEDPLVNRLLNQRLSGLYDLLIEIRGQDYFCAAPVAIPIIGNQDTYPLPADFYKLVSLDFSIGSNITRSARPFTEAERNRFKWMPGWNFNTEVFYRVNQAGAVEQITFIPMPTTSFSATLKYVPAFADLVDDAATFPAVNGWEMHAVWSVVADLLAKQERDPSFALSQVAQLEARIRGLAPRDLQEPERVQRVKRRGQGWW